MNISKNKIIRYAAIIFALGFAVAISIVLYMFNMPHRNVQAERVDYQLTATEIVNEYLNNYNISNEKYLDEEGESKILKITGEVVSISEDFNNQKVVLLKASNSEAGVSCTFTEATNTSVSKVKVGQTIAIKGVIRSGASYDKDLEMYENVILEKCDIVKL